MNQPTDTSRLAYKIHVPGSDDKFDGYAVWHHIDYLNKSAMRGITIFKPKYRGKHFGTSVGLKMMEIAKEVGFAEVIAVTENKNKASLKNLTKQFGIGESNGKETRFTLSLNK